MTTEALLNYDLQELISEAVASDCGYELIEKLQEYTNMSDFLTNCPNASYYLYIYALEVMGKRWFDAEVFIQANSPEVCVWYTRDVIRSRWFDVEPMVSKDAYSAFLYSVLILRGRWEEAEEIIKNDMWYWKEYKLIFDL